jgi:N-acetylated-alpha-linked acidic dipeptidase
MRRAITSSLMLAAAFGVSPIHAQTAQPSLAEVERQFDASLNAAEMAGWMKTMAAEPNHVGSPHDKANAEMVLAQFRDWGWDAHIETFEALYPTPISETLEQRAARDRHAARRSDAGTEPRPLPRRRGPRRGRICSIWARRR